MLTSHKVQGDIMMLLAGSELCANISGKVYREGYRPRDSRAEDIAVIFVNGRYGQVESGAVTLNIFIPDITPFDNGVYVEDGRRVAEVEMLAARWVESLETGRSNYRFSLLRTISSMADAEMHQHIVVVQLQYEYKG